jgi:hypothetical protein
LRHCKDAEVCADALPLLLLLLHLLPLLRCYSCCPFQAAAAAAAAAAASLLQSLLHHTRLPQPTTAPSTGSSYPRRHSMMPP